MAVSRTLFLVRHGQSVFNAYYAEHGRDPLIRDAPLSEIGRQQVEAARAKVGLLPAPDVVISSPLTRAIQTSVGIFGPDRVEISALHRERVEHLCDVGHPPTALAGAFPGLAFDHLDDPWWHDEDRNAHGVAVEPLDVFAGRVEDFRGWLLRRPEAVMVVVGHGTFFHHLTGRPFANCEIARVDLADWSVAETF